jgi:hypothetical protein
MSLSRSETETKSCSSRWSHSRRATLTPVLMTLNLIHGVTSLPGGNMLSWYARHPTLDDGVHGSTNADLGRGPPGPSSADRVGPLGRRARHSD